MSTPMTTHSASLGDARAEGLHIVHDRLHDVRVWLGEVEEHQPRHARKAFILDLRINTQGFQDGMERASAGLRRLPPAARRFSEAMQQVETAMKEATR